MHVWPSLNLSEISICKKRIICLSIEFTDVFVEGYVVVLVSAGFEPYQFQKFVFVRFRF